MGLKWAHGQGQYKAIHGAESGGISAGGCGVGIGGRSGTLACQCPGLTRGVTCLP
jgi:hypothetical protein